MKAGIFLLAALTLLGCSRKPGADSAVYLGPTPVYKLVPGTREVAPDAPTTKLYEGMFNFHPAYNQPLHRLVVGGNQTVYLGLVLPPLPAKLDELMVTDSAWTLVQSRPVGKGALLGLLKGRTGAYDVRYLGASVKSQMTHVINVYTQDSALAQSYYHAEPLLKGNLLL